MFYYYVHDDSVKYSCEFGAWLDRANMFSILIVIEYTTETLIG